MKWDTIRMAREGRRSLQSQGRFGPNTKYRLLTSHETIRLGDEFGSIGAFNMFTWKPVIYDDIGLRANTFAVIRRPVMPNGLAKETVVAKALKEMKTGDVVSKRVLRICCLAMLNKDPLGRSFRIVLPHEPLHFMDDYGCIRDRVFIWLPVASSDQSLFAGDRFVTYTVRRNNRRLRSRK